MKYLQDFAQLFFTKKGRMNRLEFLVCHTIVLSLIAVCMIYADTVFSNVYYEQFANQKLAGFLDFMLSYTFSMFTLTAIVSYFMICTKRLHDINASGWWLIIAFILPPLFIVGLIVMLVCPGAEEYNDYDLVI